MLQPKDILIDLEKVNRTEEYLTAQEYDINHVANSVWSGGFGAQNWGQSLIHTSTSTGAFGRLVWSNIQTAQGNLMGGIFR